MCLHDQVHEAAGDDDRLTYLFPVQMRLDARRRQSPLDELRLGFGHRRLEPIADLAVDLDNELERLTLELRRVCLRPRLLPQPLVPERGPELLGDMRRVRLD